VVLWSVAEGPGQFRASAPIGGIPIPSERGIFASDGELVSQRMTASCHRRAAAAYPELLESEAERFIDATYGADAGLPIASCPGWDAAQVGVHVGQLYRWAAEHVRTRSKDRIPGSSIDMQMPSDRAMQPHWIRSGLDILTSALESTDHDAELWAWGSDKAARFWGRRMLFETTIHRADVELALGKRPTIDPETAVDGIDEFLDNLSHAIYFAPDVEKLRGSGEGLQLSAADSGLAWWIQLLPDRFSWSHEQGGPTQAEVEGSSGDLLLFVYGRLPADDLRTEGDARLIELWTVNSRI
jgi:uncharacterized protein (TIGR03083 family)